MGTAEALELSLLQDSQELGLHGGRELADLVEEEGSVFGGLELSFSGADGAGECALLVSE